MISARPASDSYGSPENPFLSQYGNAAPQASPDLAGNFVPSDQNQPGRAPTDSYGSPGSEAGINPRIVGNPNQLAEEAVGARDVYGSPVAPVGTSAPVPQEIITAARLPDSYRGQGGDDGPEGEVTRLKVEGEDPLFDNLRDNAFTTAGVDDSTSARPDPPASTTRNALKVDLSSSGEVDLTNGLDQDSGSQSVDLTGNDDNYDDGATTTVVPLFPGYEDTDDYDQDNYQYDDSDVKTPGLPGYGQSPNQLGTYGNRPDQQGTYGNRPAVQQPQPPPPPPPPQQEQEQQPQAQQPEPVQPEPEQPEPEQQQYEKNPENAHEVVVEEEKEVETTETKEEEEEKFVEEVEVAQVEKEIAQVSDVEEEKPAEVQPQQEQGGEQEQPVEEVPKDGEVEAVEEDEEEGEGEEEGDEEDGENYDDRLPQTNDEDLFDEYDDNSADKVVGNDATTEAAFISVPLMIEEVKGEGDGEGSQPGDPTVILAGSPEETGSKPDALYKSPGPRRGRQDNERRGPHAFHQFLVEPPNAKRNADWSQKLRERQRRRVWRQFNLD